MLNSILSTDDMAAWGWRIPFICSLPLALVGMYVRTKIDDTPTFIKMKNENTLSNNPLKEMFSTARKPLVISFLSVAFANGAYYTLLTFSSFLFRDTSWVNDSPITSGHDMRDGVHDDPLSDFWDSGRSLW